MSTSTVGSFAPRRRLTIITPTYHPERIGTPLYVTDLSQWFALQGWDVHVVTNQPHYPSFRRHPGYGRRTRTDALGAIRITRLPTIVPAQGRKPLRALSDLNFLLQGMLRSARLRETDAILSVSPGTPWTALVGSAAAAAGASHVALVHDIQSGLAGPEGASGRLLQRTLQMSEQWSLNHATHVAALTSDMLEVLADIGVARPTHVLPLWSTVDSPAEFPTLDAEVQYSGNFGEKQGIDRFDELLAGFATRKIPVRIRGEGPRFDALAARLGTTQSQYVRIEGLVPHDQLSSALARSPVHLVLQAPRTSRYVMPSKIVNALACGATVVALTDPDSAVDRLSREVDGLYAVPATRPDIAIETVADIMAAARLPERRRAIAEHASGHFSKAAVLPRLAALLADGSSR